MIIAQKETERYSTIVYEQEYVHITIKKIKVKDIDEKRLREFFDSILTDNDPEQNYFEYGISTDWDGDLLIIDVEKFIEGLNNWKNNQLEEDEEDKSIFMQDASVLIFYLNKYIGYDFHFEDDKIEIKP